MAAKLSRSVVMFSTDYGLGIINGATNGPDRHAADTDDAYAVTLAVQSTDVQAIVHDLRERQSAALRGVRAAGALRTGFPGSDQPCHSRFGRFP